MTLIINWLTPYCTIQVSDRRLTIDDGTNEPKLGDDNRNKAVVWRGKRTYMSFAYTGVTPLDGKRTDDWLADVLIQASEVTTSTDDDFLGVLEHLRCSATQALQKLESTQNKRYGHAFVGTGWHLKRLPIDPPNKAHVLPISSVISNALNNRLEWLSQPKPDFSIQLCGTDEPGTVFFALGQPLAASIRKSLLRNLHRSLSRNSGPNVAALLMAEAVRATAKRNAKVGSNLMVNCIPAAAAANSFRAGPNALYWEHARPNADTSSFQYISKRRTEAYGPHIVYGTGSARYLSIEAEVNPITGEINGKDASITIQLNPPSDGE